MSSFLIKISNNKNIRVDLNWRKKSHFQSGYSRWGENFDNTNQSWSFSAPVFPFYTDNSPLGSGKAGSKLRARRGFASLCGLQFFAIQTGLPSGP